MEGSLAVALAISAFEGMGKQIIDVGTACHQPG
jgi:hypothetical protein